MGRTEELILRTYEAFRRGEVDGVVANWAHEGTVKPLPHSRIYRGPGDIRRFLESEMPVLEQYDFRVYTILEQQAEHALIFGRYSVKEHGAVVDKGIFWIARVRDEKFVSFEAFENVGEAFAEFKQRLGKG